MVGPVDSIEAKELHEFFQRTVMKNAGGTWSPIPGGCSSYWLPFSDQVDDVVCFVKHLVHSLPSLWIINTSHKTQVVLKHLRSVGTKDSTCKTASLGMQ